MAQIKPVAPLARVSPSPAPIPVQEVQPMGASALPLNSTPPNGNISSRRRPSNGDSNVRSTPGRGNDTVDYAADLLQSPGEIRSPSSLGDMTRISREKEDLVRRLRFLMDVERDGLEVELGRRLEELEEMKKRHREEETKLQLEITSLSEKLD